MLIRKQCERIVGERVCYCHPAFDACYSGIIDYIMLAYAYGRHLQTHEHHTCTPIDLSEYSIMSNHPVCLYSMDDGYLD